MNSRNLEPGWYLYCMPTWDRPIAVKVEKRGPELAVRFHEGRFPTSMNDIPAAATFEPIQEDNHA